MVRNENLIISEMDLLSTFHSVAQKSTKHGTKWHQKLHQITSESVGKFPLERKYVSHETIRDIRRRLRKRLPRLSIDSVRNPQCDRCGLQSNGVGRSYKASMCRYPAG